MNEDVKKAWITALRSGEYQQGAGYLKRGDDFCCLGVLCDLYRKQTGSEDWRQVTFDGTRYDTMFSHGKNLPGPVRAWAELADQNPIIHEHPKIGGITSLAELNDEGYSFPQIANIIEKEL